MPGTNLLLNCWRLTSQKEDLLTEFFAATLRADTTFARRFTSLLLATDIEEPPRSIETQVSYASGSPDMRFLLADGRVILVENKLDAAETMRGSGEAEVPEPQLERYLTESVDGVAYIRADWKPPKAEVLAHPHYLSPQGRPHFLWRDFHPLLLSSGNTLSVWLREVFESFGFTPPLPGVGDLQDPDDKARLLARQNFAKNWDRLRARAEGLGWRSEIASKSELYLTARDPDLIEEVFVSPNRPDRFLIRLTPAGEQSDLDSHVQLAYAGSDFDPEIQVKFIRRARGTVPVVEVLSTLPAVLNGEEHPDSIARRLEAAVAPILDLAESR